MAPLPLKVIDLWHPMNLWLAPNMVTCFGVVLAGRLPEEEMRRRERIVAERRRAWTPDVHAWRQLQELTNDIVRRRVILKIWHPIIVALPEDEGPYPIAALCAGIEARLDATGILQAYLRFEQAELVHTPDGFDARELFVTRTNDGAEWINLGDLYGIVVLADQPK